MALEEPFFMKKLIYSLALCGSLTVVPTISEAALGDATLHPGTSNSDVKELQQKLKNKGYFTYGTTTNYYGSITTSAVKSFQRANGLSADGIAGPSTFNKLLGSGSSSISSSSLLRVGSTGPNVQSLQQQLKNKGYFKGTTTQYFGSITKNAVKAFQRANGLLVDGEAGPDTLNKLNSSSSSSSKPSTSTGSSTSSSSASKVISYGKRFMGTPYVWGGAAPGGFDCSGYLNYVYRNAVGVSLPRTVASIYQTGTRVSSPQPGDIVFFETYQPGASHAGIYIGNGQFMHAGSSTGVTITSLSNSYWSKRYLGAKRYL